MYCRDLQIFNWVFNILSSLHPRKILIGMCFCFLFELFCGNVFEYCWIFKLPTMSGRKFFICRGCFNMSTLLCRKILVGYSSVTCLNLLSL